MEFWIWKYQSIGGFTTLVVEYHEDFPTPFGSKQCCNKSACIVLFWKVLICSFLKRVLCSVSAFGNDAGKTQEVFFSNQSSGSVKQCAFYSSLYYSSSCSLTLPRLSL